jgi:hypothetical protein
LENPGTGGALSDASLEDGRMCGSGGCGRFLTGTTGTLDMLFVVDSSRSMQQEQASLALEFPRLMRKLTSGDHNEDGTPEYEPVVDLHLGVVSTNRGAYQRAHEGCSGTGDSGRLLHSPVAAGCERELPAFLTYEAGGDGEQVAQDFACLTQLGTLGCGYEQPLESALQALWPSADSTLQFIAEDSDSMLGRGDRDNAGFLRNDPEGEPATLAIVLVTDEDDCSAFDPMLWAPPSAFLPEDPRIEQPLNLRCFHNRSSLYEIERYHAGFRALHGWTGARVLFAAIVGVPVELVDQAALSNVDWNDTAQREAHYDKILNHPRMIEKIDEVDTENLATSCDTEHGVAYPPRRIVQLARKFGPNSLVQSICGDNLGPPIDIIVRHVVEAPL